MEGTAVFGWYPVPFIYTIRARSSTEQSTALGGEGGGPSERGFVQRCGLPPSGRGCSDAPRWEWKRPESCDAMRATDRGASGRARGHGQVNQCTRPTDITSTAPLPPSSLRAHPFSPRAARNSDNEAYLMWATGTGGATTHSELAVRVEQTMLP